MSTSIENQPDFAPYASPAAPPINPYASPAATLERVKSLERLPYRASSQTLRHVNHLAIAADLSYVATGTSFLVGLYFLGSETEQYALIVFWVTLFLLWYTVVAALFRAKGLSFSSVLTPFLLPLPIIGIVVFLSAKEGIRDFMIENGYRPRFLGFAVDSDERHAMDQDPKYTPSLLTNHDGSRRRHVFSLGECWILFCLGSYLLLLLSIFIGVNSTF